MDKDTQETQTAAQSERRRRLQAGERIFWYRSTLYFIAVAAFTAVSILFLWLWFGMISFWMTGRPGRMTTTDTRGIAVILGIGAGWFITTLFEWGRVLFSTIALSNGHLEIRNWQGRIRHMEYADVVAVLGGLIYTGQTP